jgi:hypothetical protein
MRQTGLVGLPGIGGLFSGWRLGARRYLNPAAGELYSARRRLAVAADERPELAVHLYGSGWQGQQISWCPLYPRRSYECTKAAFVEDRLSTLARYRFSLAFENWRGDKRYITDRIFDGFLAGAVPVYLGDESADGIFPTDAFVDARQFRGERELLDHLAVMPERRWQEMRACGQEFLASHKAREFSNETFADRMVEALRSLA